MNASSFQQASYSSQHNDVRVCEFAGTAGIQSYVNEAGMAESQIKYNLSLVSYLRLLVLEQEKI